MANFHDLAQRVHGSEEELTRLGLVLIEESITNWGLHSKHYSNHADYLNKESQRLFEGTQRYISMPDDEKENLEFAVTSIIQANYLRSENRQIVTIAGAIDAVEFLVENYGKPHARVEGERRAILDIARNVGQCFMSAFAGRPSDQKDAYRMQKQTIRSEYPAFLKSLRNKVGRLTHQRLKLYES